MTSVTLGSILDTVLKYDNVEEVLWLNFCKMDVNQSMLSIALTWLMRVKLCLTFCLLFTVYEYKKNSSLFSLPLFFFHSPQIAEGRNWDDYILVSQDGDLQPTEGETAEPFKQGQGFGMPEFQDPLMGTMSGSSSPEEGSTNSKDSDFTIVNPVDLWTLKLTQSIWHFCPLNHSKRMNHSAGLLHLWTWAHCLILTPFKPRPCFISCLCSHRPVF